MAGFSSLLRGWIYATCRLHPIQPKVGYQPQARYFFIMLLPGALLLTGGLYTLAARQALSVTAFGVLFIALGLLNTLALVTVSKAGIATGGVRQNARSRLL
jgi:hypothetical protein